MPEAFALPLWRAFCTKVRSCVAYCEKRIAFCLLFSPMLGLRYDFHLSARGGSGGIGFGRAEPNLRHMQLFSGMGGPNAQAARLLLPEKLKRGLPLSRRLGPCLSAQA